MKFIGWTPTVTGRHSFSAIGGADGHGRATICNFIPLGPACVFGIGNRTSRDGPIPPWLLRGTRIERADFVTYLEAKPGKLPFPGLNGVELREDPMGVLEGVVIVLLAGSGQALVRDRLRQFENLTIAAKDPNRTEADHLASNAEAKNAVDELWTSLQNVFRNNPRQAPAFARVQVRIYRSGQTEIDVAPENLYLTFASRSAQSSGSFQETHPAFRTDAQLTARQIFHFVRDLVHRHYHHSPNSDLATTPHLSTEEDDFTWRKETHYGLLRMAILQRREDQVLSYKQALGILAYAETFQTQLAGWTVSEAGKCVVRSDFFQYQFKPFRDSIEARVRLLETKHSTRRATLTFIFATFLSTLVIIIGGSNLFHQTHETCRDGIWTCGPSADFWAIINFATLEPFYALLSVVLVAFVAAILTDKYSNNEIAAYRGGTGRFLDATMGQFARIQIRLAFPVGVALLVFLIALQLVAGYGVLQLAEWLLQLVH